eukprot:m.31846 g.31846  ORF g.31846 m.31846 type:complete len:69 (+) comp31562_c0_seq2:108-314(+)
MAAFDFKNENQLKVAMLVYLDLCEGRYNEDTSRMTFLTLNCSKGMGRRADAWLQRARCHLSDCTGETR